ncbi:MAG: sulfotransferase family protein [Ilyomonas sp.]
MNDDTKVFGIGLNKTGTTSLGKALVLLGYKNHAGCNLKLTKCWSSSNLKPIYEVANQNNCFEDWPWPLVYREMFYKFENAKFILTVRKSADRWYQSLCKYSVIKSKSKFRRLIYGFHMPHNYRKEHIDFYEKHNQSVIDFFNEKAPEKLLIVCWEEGHGWQQLCKFLGKELPVHEFPHLNKSENSINSKSNTIGNPIKRVLKKFYRKTKRLLKLKI